MTKLAQLLTIIIERFCSEDLFKHDNIRVVKFLPVFYDGSKFGSSQSESCEYQNNQNTE